MIKPYFYFVALLLHIAPIFGLEINGYTIGPNASLSNANLVGADLSGIDLTGSNLHNANLTNANLSNAILRDCN